MDFARRYPAKMTPLLRRHKLGFRETLAACIGQYLAALEGDKLQSQVDFLDMNGRYAAIAFSPQ
jgi:hypothetical protein